MVRWCKKRPVRARCANLRVVSETDNLEPTKLLSDVD